MNTLEDRIRRRAYQLWEEAGRSGHPDDHWLQAERELASGSPDPRGATVEDRFRSVSSEAKGPRISAIQSPTDAGPFENDGLTFTWPRRRPFLAHLAFSRLWEVLRE